MIYALNGLIRFLGWLSIQYAPSREVEYMGSLRQSSGFPPLLGVHVWQECEEVYFYWDLDTMRMHYFGAATRFIL